jgi:cold shock CspA family protein
MRIHGTLIKWNDDRGFGFVALPQSREEVFVHISAFPKDGNRPRVGETISFEVLSGPDGRKRAEGVMRPGARTTPAARYRRAGVERKRNPWGAGLTMLVVVALGLAGFRAYSSRHDDSDEAISATPKTLESSPQRFTCDGRTHCSQMTSCEEAVYFLRHCPGTEMDGNGDGEPCEQQWCN